MGSDAVELVEDLLAGYRLTHLVTEDVFPPIQKARDAILDWYGADHPVGYLVTCPWCVGVWAGFGIAAARAAAPRAWRHTARALSAAAAAGLIETVARRLE